MKKARLQTFTESVKKPSRINENKTIGSIKSTDDLFMLVAEAIFGGLSAPNILMTLKGAMWLAAGYLGGMDKAMREAEDFLVDMVTNEPELAFDTQEDGEPSKDQIKKLMKDTMKDIKRNIK